MGCKKSKVKVPKRADVEELEEAERLQREKKEAERLALEKEKEELEEKARQKRLEEEEKRRLEEEEKRRLEEEKKRLEEEERQRLEEKKRLEEEEIKRLQEEEERRLKELANVQSSPIETHMTGPPETVNPVPELPETVDLVDHTHEFQSSPPGSSINASPQITQRSTPRRVDGVTPCDMTAIDMAALAISKRCGCYLGDFHDENQCGICNYLDLSDAPLLS